MNDRIKQLQKEIDREKKIMMNCNHDFCDPFYNPKIVNEPYGYKMIKQGSDIWGETEGYKEVKKPRWTKICNHCGFEKHTSKTEAIIKEHKPKFD